MLKESVVVVVVVIVTSTLNARECATISIRHVAIFFYQLACLHSCLANRHAHGMQETKTREKNRNNSTGRRRWCRCECQSHTSQLEHYERRIVKNEVHTFEIICMKMNKMIVYEYI